VAVSLIIMAMARPAEQRDPVIPEAPALLPSKDAASCASVSGDQRVALAAERLRIARAKQERSPFFPPDGIDAVSYFEGAAACYRAVSMMPDATSATQSADALWLKVDEDYRVRRVRLEHSFRVHDVPAMKRELDFLIPMTAQRRGPYTEWLAAVDRNVIAELEAKGRLWNLKKP
jgi:hypothetical protein